MRVPRPAGLKVLRTQTTISVCAASGRTLACSTLRAAFRQGVRVVVTHFVQQLRFLILSWVRGENTVYVGPDDEFVGIDKRGR